MKKTMQKPFALLLALLMIFGMGTAAFAADDPQSELDAAINALVDPVNLQFYTDDSILLVAHALGGDYLDAQVFLDDAIRNGYQYLGENTDEAMLASAQALRALTPDVLERDESKATVDLRIVPVEYNGALVDAAESIPVKAGGDRITFAVELKTNYYVSAADLPIVFDCTKFNLVNVDGEVYANDGDGTNGVYNFRDASPATLINTECQRMSIKKNYEIDCFTVSSVPAQYPAAYRTEDYMSRNKILLAEMLPRISNRTVPQIFGETYLRLFTFTLQVRDDVAFDATESFVGIPNDWYATFDARENLFAVTRAAGQCADGVTPATNGSTARWPYEIFDIDAQFGQTVNVQSTTVRFSPCAHVFELIDRKEPTIDEEGYETYRCQKCGYTFTKTLAPLSGAVLELSSVGRAKAGKTVDVTVTMRNNPGIVAMRIGLEYDTNVLQLIDVEDGGLLGQNTIETSPDYDSMPFWVLWADALSENYTENGTLVTFRFRVRDDAPMGSTEVKLNVQENDTFNQALVDQKFFTKDMFLRVTRYVRGDANMDGIVSVKDAVIIRRWLVGGIDEDDIDLENADYDLDGKVTLKDAILIIRHLAGWVTVI